MPGMTATAATAPAGDRQAEPLGQTLPDRRCLPMRFDPAAMAADLASADATGWTRHFVTSNYAGDWSAIALRAPAGETHPIRQIAPTPGVSAWIDMPLLQASPAFQAVLATFECPIESVRLMKLAPGSAILPHRDHDLNAAEGCARLHVPIVTNDRVWFRVGDARVDMRPGECWYLRLSDEHAAANEGETDRVHIVIDVIVNDWMLGMIRG